MTLTNEGNNNYLFLSKKKKTCKDKRDINSLGHFVTLNITKSHLSIPRHFFSG